MDSHPFLFGKEYTSSPNFEQFVDDETQDHCVTPIFEFSSYALLLLIGLKQPLTFLAFLGLYSLDKDMNRDSGAALNIQRTCQEMKHF